MEQKMYFCSVSNRNIKNINNGNTRDKTTPNLSNSVAALRIKTRQEPAVVLPVP